MDSYIDKYNKEVEEKCKEIMMNKKNIIRRDILAPNKIFNSNMGGFVSEPNLTKNQFINTIKNGYVNLGEKTPSVSQLEDLYIKSFKNFSFEEFAEFMDLVQFGNFQTIEDAYKSFIIDLKNRDDIMGSSLDNPLYPNNRFSQIQEDYDEEGEDTPDEEAEEDILIRRTNDLFEEIDTNVSQIEPIQPIITPSPPPRPRPRPSPRLPPPPPPPPPPVSDRVQIRYETSPSGILSSNLVQRSGRPPSVELPQNIREQLDFYSSRP